MDPDPDPGGPKKSEPGSPTPLVFFYLPTSSSHVSLISCADGSAEGLGETARVGCRQQTGGKV